MPAWNEARRAGQRARARVKSEHAAPGSFEGALPLAKVRFERQVCVYCGGNARLRTGYLAISGPVFFCKNHADQYQDDKDWETKHKREMGII